MTWMVQAAAAAALLLGPRPGGVAGAAPAPARADPAVAPGTRATPGPDPGPPRLVVVVTVDQLWEEYLERYASQLSGGLGRFLRGGAFFPNAWHDHAVTETAPGHATVLSGRFPRGTGIVANSPGVMDPQEQVVGRPGAAGYSPFRFRGSVLIDWLRAADAGSRALSVSRKDRGAILPLGRAHQQVYVYTPDGTFTTSTYYADTLPTWVRRFNERHEPQRYAGRAWTLLLPDSAYAEPDSVPIENRGRDFTFPHVLPAAPAAAASALPNYPFMDQVTLDLALDGLNALRLGAGEHTDLLAVSLSTTDAIGHGYGPDSREIHDQVLRVDRMLGAFVDSIYRLRDSTRVIFALTADHGVSPFPELHAPSPEAARALHVNIGPVMAGLYQDLATQRVPATAFRLADGMLTVDPDAFAAAGVNLPAVVDAFVAAARRVPGVARVDYVADLGHQDTVHDAIARRWLHMVPPDLPIPVVVTLQPLHVWGNATTAQHGSPHDSDAHVPILFYGPPFRPGRYQDRVLVVDIAPTLAAVLGVRPTEPLDGRVLRQALRDAPPFETLAR